MSDHGREKRTTSCPPVSPKCRPVSKWLPAQLFIIHGLQRCIGPTRTCATLRLAQETKLSNFSSPSYKNAFARHPFLQPYRMVHSTKTSNHDWRAGTQIPTCVCGGRGGSCLMITCSNDHGCEPILLRVALPTEVAPCALQNVVHYFLRYPRAF